MASLTSSYSGVVINQNASPTELYQWRSKGANYLYQTFTLPSDYQRGTTEYELNIPDISGFQFYVEIDEGYAQSAALDYLFQYYDQEWITLASGTQVGSHSDGLCWFDVIFPTSIPISYDMLSSEFRIGIQARSASEGTIGQPVSMSQGGQYIVDGSGFSANLTPGEGYPISLNGQPAYLLANPDNSVTWGMQQGISAIGCVAPTPLTGQAISTGEAFIADGITPLVTGTSSLNFRVLGLVADNGTDFLGNSYRSAVVTHSINNATSANATAGDGSSTSGVNHFQSPPLPSRFAVVPTYWDVRPVPENPSYGGVNLISNPSFEHDALNKAPAGWTIIGQGFSASEMTVEASNQWATNGDQSLYIGTPLNPPDLSTGTGYYGGGIISGFIPIDPTQQYVLAIKANIITMPTDGFLSLNIIFYNAAGTQLGSVEATNSSAVDVPAFTTGVGTINLPINDVHGRMIPAGTTQVQVQLTSVQKNTDSVTTVFYVDEFFFSSSNMVPFYISNSFAGNAWNGLYFDGDSPGCTWLGQIGNSPSAQVIQPTVQDDTIVIDSIMVDPITPNMAFNVYYSTDDAGNQDDMTQMQDTDWENKMWTRVPQVYIATQSQEYALPEPIVAKYVCVEFTNLQSQSYDPGPFQQPVSYKKFPTWVANFFIAEMEDPSFITDQINVQYDALDFMYNYYLDDLQQEPATPQAAPTDAASQLTNYFNSGNNTTGIDSATLAQINLVMNQFTQTPDNNVDPSSLLGSYVQSLYSGANPPNSTLETGSLPPIDYSAVSSLQREPVLFEQSLPVMYFFLTCRHGYKELQATFDYNRAYFCAVNAISFLRNDYTTEADTPIYIESGGDLQNATINDFVMGDDGSWYASVGNSQQ